MRDYTHSKFVRARFIFLLGHPIRLLRRSEKNCPCEKTFVYAAVRVAVSNFYLDLSTLQQCMQSIHWRIEKTCIYIYIFLIYIHTDIYLFPYKLLVSDKTVGAESCETL